MVYSLYCESAGQLAGKTAEAGEKKLGSGTDHHSGAGCSGLVIYFIVSRMWREISSLTRNMPAMYADLEQVMDDIGQNLNGLFQMLPAGIQNGWREMMGNLDQSIGNMMGNLSEPTVTAAGNVAKRIPTWLVSTIVTIIFSIFLHRREGRSDRMGKKSSAGPAGTPDEHGDVKSEICSRGLL